MTAADLPTPALLALAAALAFVGLLAGTYVTRATEWAPAGGLALLVATPLVPHVPVAGGLSLDDILPLLGIALLVATIDPRRLKAMTVPKSIMFGLVLMIGAGLVSSVANAPSVTEFMTMAARTPGRYALLTVIGGLVALAYPPHRRLLIVARSMVLVGTTEAIFGLTCFFFALDIGLEPTRKFSVLYQEVPGRIAGTLGISPNFLGAIFLLTITATAGLAIQSEDRRGRWFLWSSVLVQVLALTLTFTRASLGLTIVALAVLLLLRGRVRFMAPIMLMVAVGFAATPVRSNAPEVPTSPAPQAPVGVERLTSDIPDRLALWYSAGLMMVDNPLFGVGPGRTLDAAQSDPGRYVNTPFGVAASTAHNTVLLPGAEAGVVAAVGAILVNVGLALAGLKVIITGRTSQTLPVETAGAIAVLAFLAQGMVNNLFNVAVTGVVFAVIAGPYVVKPHPPAGGSSTATLPSSAKMPPTTA